MVKNKLPKIKIFKPYIDNNHTITVVGCGGTGSYLVSNLARLVSNSDCVTNLYLFDGDVVEEKNLIRQNFIAPDIGKNKAEVLAERYSRAFGIEIKAIPAYLENIKDILDSTIVIGCVDNNATRRVINESFTSYKYRNMYWIDSGNEEAAGQVVCGFKLNNMIYGVKDIFSLPSVFEIYNDMLNNIENARFNSELSCAERAVSAPQNILTNITAATLIMNFVQKILYCKDMKIHSVEFSIDNVFSSRLNTEENLNSVDIQRKHYTENY